MAKDFSFPFYVNNWMGGVQYFTFEQKGAYLELLILQFNHGRFTETQVKQVLNISYSNVWQVIKDKFNTDGTYYWNERMEEVKEDRRLFVESRRQNRIGKKKKVFSVSDNNTTLTSDVHMESESESESIDDSGGMGVEIKYPTIEEFLDYCKEVLKDKFDLMEFALKAKYDSWVENKWKDGNGSKIKIWKTKIRNTIPYLKPFQQQSQAPEPRKSTKL